MAHNQRNYDTEYKVQAVKLSQEIGAAKAASELGVCVDTLYGWRKAARDSINIWQTGSAHGNSRIWRTP